MSSHADIPPDAGKNRCAWACHTPEERDYHDTEWGIPLHDDRKLFEFLVLEGAQAGLSWITILRKREAYRRAFADFDPLRVSEFGTEEITALMGNPGIVRNPLKIRSAIQNARRLLDIAGRHGSFDAWVWRFVDGQPILNHWRSHEEIPASSRESVLMSRELKSQGFAFVGPVICYAYMQATGMVNDHTIGCFRAAQT